MSSNYFQDKLQNLLQQPAALAGVIAAITIIAGIIVFVVVVVIRKRRILHKQAYLGSHDHGDKRTLMSTPSSSEEGMVGVGEEEGCGRKEERQEPEGCEVKVALVEEEGANDRASA